MWMWVIINQFEVFVLEIEDALHVGVDLHLWQFTRFTCQLQLCLLEVVEIEVSVACRIDEIAWLQVAHLCHHHGQQGIRGNVERHTQERVRTSLIQLATQFAVSHIKLEQDVAGGQVHVVDISYIPSRYNQSA